MSSEKGLASAVDTFESFAMALAGTAESVMDDVRRAVAEGDYVKVATCIDALCGIEMQTMNMALAVADIAKASKQLRRHLGIYLQARGVE